ncbi:winged helix-turn-helix domain-containing protein [Rossellomorea aquimaris]|uniref:Transcriptional regulator n=1 Tax=Rossellomorea aquimaris TaxID=189382 RepID=A0A366EPR7_9BACI|nr:winged helix-turn-helix domain-containing protein [Rossellomorea aquimaris]RBP04407.1 transcriptional regulator [Rossellomorea aquimaris]
MDNIKLLHNEYILKYHSEEIHFLRKEFLLFECLFRSPSRIFTRDELLDAVWTREEPTDRTVDDHIYRVRKKLKPLSSIMSVETIRGVGYKLKIREMVRENVLLKDDAVSSSMAMLFRKYHLYGQGDALKLLEENQSVLGFEMNIQNRLYLQFMKGNFKWIAESSDIPFWDRCYYLLHIYSYIARDKKKCLEYFTKATSNPNIPVDHRTELEWLNRLPLLVFNGQLEEAEILLAESKKVVHEKKVDGFIPLLSFIELYILLSKKEDDRITGRLLEIEKELEQYPFLREKASFMVIKGIASLYKRDAVEAKYYFDRGLDQFLQARYVPGLFISLNIILFYLTEFVRDRDLSQFYAIQLKRYEEEFQLVDLEFIIRNQLDAFL